MDSYHVPVLPVETLHYLDIKKGQKYIDCTLGGGGHTQAILQAGGKVLALDQDQDAIDNANQNLAKEIENGDLKVVKTNFAHLKEVAQKSDFQDVSGILFDLGVSTHQLAVPQRGFSFNLGGELDMRMNQTDGGAKARDLVNAGSESELAHLFWEFGEERMAKRIARAIVEFRKTKLLETTDELANLILRVRPRGKGDRMHPATRVFQALRIAVNSEIDVLPEALQGALEVLGEHGRLVVISFHSLEDRIVKNFISENKNLLNLTDKPVMATQEELEKNMRSHSAKLRAAEKQD